MSSAHIIIGLIILIQCLGAIAVIAIVGKDRKPLTHGTAIVSVMMTALEVAGLFYVAHQIH